MDCVQPAAALGRQPAAVKHPTASPSPSTPARLHSRLWQQSGSRLPQSKITMNRDLAHPVPEVFFEEARIH